MLFEVRLGGGRRSSGWDSDTFGLRDWIHKNLSRAVWISSFPSLSISVSRTILNVQLSNLETEESRWWKRKGKERQP